MCKTHTAEHIPLLTLRQFTQQTSFAFFSFLLLTKLLDFRVLLYAEERLCDNLLFGLLLHFGWGSLLFLTLTNPFLLHGYGDQDGQQEEYDSIVPTVLRGDIENRYSKHISETAETCLDQCYRY
jgi:hypothetical protein